MPKLNKLGSLHILVTLLLSCLLSKVTEAGQAGFTDNAYENITVAINERISSSQQNAIINGVKTLFKTASPVLFNAIGQRGYFGSINFILPSTWQNGSQLTGELSKPSKQPLYYSADIRIAPKNVAYGDLPYTQQSRGCGEPGDFIHLTPDFVKNLTTSTESTFGPAENLLVREWIKYRYGVFDENGFAFDINYPQMYFGAEGVTQYNMCNDTVVLWSSSSCNYDGDVEGLPSDCNLMSNRSSSTNVTSSMLSSITLPVAHEMCHNESDHNAEAPNKQNNLCNGQSAMEVILKHDDFLDGRNPPVDMDIPDPVYYEDYDWENASLVFYLIWDPMTLDQTYYTAGPALLKFVYLDFPSSSYFGVIQTSDVNTPLISPTQVTGANRYALWTQLANGLTSSETPIGNVYSAVKTATEELKSFDYSESTAYGLVVMSNTEDNTPWSSVCSYANDMDVHLHLVTFSDSVAQEFNRYCKGESIVIDSGSNVPINITTTTPAFTTDSTTTATSAFTTDSTTTSSVTTTLTATGPPEKADDRDHNLASDDIKVCLSNLIQRAELDLALMSFPAIITQAFTLPFVYYLRTFPYSMTGNFTANATYIDSTYFYVDTCRNIEEHPPATLLSVWLGDSHNLIHYDDIIQAFFNGQPLSEDGTWKFGVEQSQVRDISAPYTVYAVGDALPKNFSTDGISIEFQAWAVTDQLSSKWTTVRIFASVTNGTTPVYDAKVVATIKCSSSNTSNATQVVLLDNGSGNPDTTASDGVYSSYFTQLELTEGDTPAVYTVLITANDNGGVAKYPTGEYPWITLDKNQDVEYTEPFEKEEIIKFLAQKVEDIDDIPPGNIADLHVSSIQGTTVILEWTAPGDDLDYGTASKYVFKCSADRNELLINFDNLPDSEIPAVLPGLPGYTQTVTFAGIADRETRYCAIKTYDEFVTNDTAPMSNIVSYYIESR